MVLPSLHSSVARAESYTIGDLPDIRPRCRRRARKWIPFYLVSEKKEPSPPSRGLPFWQQTSPNFGKARSQLSQGNERLCLKFSYFATNSPTIQVFLRYFGADDHFRCTCISFHRYYNAPGLSAFSLSRRVGRIPNALRHQGF